MKYEGTLKRSFDLALGGICTAALLAPMTLVTLFNAAYLRENPFYLAERIGKDQKPFKMIKLKTMRTLYDNDGNLLPDEERKTAYGHFLRYTAIDEIPQLINVLKGDMSLVGPRPIQLKEFNLSEEEVANIYAVRPGMTGPWQVAAINIKEKMSEEERMKHETSYVRDGITFKKDLELIFHTPITFLKGHDALPFKHK